MKIRNPFNWNILFGTIPSDFKEAMTYEEQIMWLYGQLKEIKEGSANYNYNLLENKPSIEGVILQGNITKNQLGITENYNNLSNRPLINNVQLSGNKSLTELGIQEKLVAGSGIRISGNVISATGGGGGGSGTSDYTELDNLPQINDVTLIGNKTSEDLSLQHELSISWNGSVEYGKTLNGNVQIGDIILKNSDIIVNTTPAEEYAVFVKEVEKYDNIIIGGDCTIIEVNSEKNVTKIEEAVNYKYNYTANYSGKIYVGFYNCTSHHPYIKQVETGISNYYKNNLQTLETNYLKDNFYKLIKNSESYMNLNFKNDKILLTGTPATQTDYPNGKYVIVELSKIYTDVLIKGFCDHITSMILYLDSSYNVLSRSNENMLFENLSTYTLKPASGTYYVAFNFTNITEYSPELYILEAESYKKAKILDNNIVLTASNMITNLDSGFYKFSDGNGLYYHNATVDNILFLDLDGIFYFDKQDQQFSLSTSEIIYDSEYENDWLIYDHSNITNEIINSRNKIPTSQAVYNELQNRKAYSIDELKATDDDDILDQYKDGSLFIKDFVDDTQYPQVRTSLNSVFFWDTTDISAKWKSLSKASNTFESAGGGSYYYDSEFKTFDIDNNGTNWTLTDRSFEIKRNGVDITSTTNADFIPTVGQVRNYVASNVANYSTSEHIVGTWIDGKPLYEKVVTGTVPTVATDGTAVSATYDITNNIENVFIMTSFVNYSGGGSVWTLPFYNNDMYHLKSQIVKASNQRKIQLSSSGTVYNNSTFVIVVRYTKTTD